jgi:group I intron endonuclease
LSLLRKNSHHSIILQNAWNKYGEDAFMFEVLERCDPARCIIKEQSYLDARDPYYNVCKTAGSSLGRKHSNVTKAKLSKVQTGKFFSHTEETKQRISRSKLGKSIPKLQGENHPRSKLLNSDVIHIQLQLRDGIPSKTLAHQFSVDVATINRCRHRPVGGF